MPLAPWKKVRQALEIRNPWWTYRKDDLMLPSGRPGEYHYVHVQGSSLIVPLLPDGRIIMVNQYRYLSGRESIEFPCGSVKEGSSHDETARHELEEETGYRAGTLVPAGEFNPYNGVTDEICRIYIARDLAKTQGRRPDETEEFEYLYPGPGEIDRMVADNTIWDGMTLAAWSLVREKVRG